MWERTQSTIVPKRDLGGSNALSKFGMLLSIFLFASQQRSVSAFGQLAFVDRRKERLCRLYSSTGGDSRPPPPDDDNNDSGSFGDFLNPRDESENLRRARDYMSDQSLPLSFGGDEEDDETDAEAILEDEDNPNGALVARSGALLDGPSQEALAKNPYMQAVSKLSPSELISKFTATANPRVQDAVRNTVLGLIGSLPKMAFETTTITTGQRLASLMFQLQMTGYLFKNADYRLSLSQSLGSSLDNYQLRLPGTSDDDDEETLPVNGKIKGKLKLKYGSANGSEKEKERQNSTSTIEMEVDAAAYMSELRSEVKQLRDELTKTKKSKEEAIRKDLLLYIRTLPEQELRTLTSTMSPDVLVTMKGLVNAVISGIGDGQITADTVTEQSGEAMAQLCMWQLVVGYNLRELEVREEMRKNLLSSYKSDSDGGLDLSEPGILE